MSAHSATILARPSSDTSSGIRLARRTLAVCVVTVTSGLLIAGCDATTPSAPEAFAAGAPSRSLSAPFDQNVPQGDTADVVAVAAAWDVAWNAGNAAGIGALFVDDGEMINGRGQIAVGAATIRANHAALFAGVFLGSHSRGIVRRVTFLSGSTAVLDVDNELTGFRALPGGGVPTEPGLNRGRHKRVLVKRAGHWRTLQLQLTTVAPAASAP
ncbi:MAG: hypothetical protein JWL95_2415 [Gemmatimonadetes bacterium]|nr:hypothetical protein [Gemmatimonadota bacterium]